jgi:hypothetical protein
MNSLIASPRSRSLLEPNPGVVLPSFGAGADTVLFDRRLEAIKKLVSGSVGQLAHTAESDTKSLDQPEKLKNKLAALKRLLSSIAMYLEGDWRLRLLKTLDALLDPEDWNSESTLPSEQSFSTFLRMIIYLHPTRRPGLGLSLKGHFLAAWSHEGARIVIECLAQDEVRWVLSRTGEYGIKESGAGKVLIHRIPDVTAGYEPESLFNNGHSLLAR